MEHLVLKFFYDKELGKSMFPDSYFICEDLENITQLASHNFILPNENIKDLNKQEVKEPLEVEEHPKEEVKKTSTRKQRAKKTSDA